jgi:hypothetical protein
MRRTDETQLRLPTLDALFSGPFGVDANLRLVPSSPSLPGAPRPLVRAVGASDNVAAETETTAPVESAPMKDAVIDAEYSAAVLSRVGEEANDETAPSDDRLFEPEIHVRILGPLKISGLRSSPRWRVALELLCFLACHPDERFTADELREHLRPASDDGETVSGKTFCSYASALRTATGHVAFPEACGGTYGLGPGVVTDWDWFRAEVAFARAQPPDRARLLLAPAFDLIRGPLFSGVPKGRYGWAFDDGLVSQIEVAIVEAASVLAELCFDAEEPEVALAGLGRALLATKDVGVADDLLTTAGATGNPATLERAWRDVRGALGEQAAGLEPAYEACRRRVSGAVAAAR